MSSRRITLKESSPSDLNLFLQLRITTTTFTPHQFRSMFKCHMSHMHVADLVSFGMDHVFCPSFEVFYLDIAKCSQLLNTKKRNIFDTAITYGCFHINLVYGKILMKIGEKGSLFFTWLWDVRFNVYTRACLLNRHTSRSSVVKTQRRDKKIWDTAISVMPLSCFIWKDTKKIRRR